MKKPLILPKFKNEDEEREFWNNLDLSEYYEPSDMVSVSFPNLKPTSQPISIRLPTYMVDRLKEKANFIDVPYQALIKQYIHAGLLRDNVKQDYDVGEKRSKKRSRKATQLYNA